MSVRKLAAVSLLCAASTGTALAQTMDINLGDKSASFHFNTLMGGSTFGRTELGAGLIYNENKNRVIDLSLLVVDTAGSKTPGLEVGVGPKFLYLRHDDSNSEGAAIALGGRLRYKMPSVKRVVIGGEAYYAPSITSFMDADNAYELQLRVGYEVLPTATAYIGFRNVHGSFSKAVGNESLDRSGHLGIQFTF